MIKLKSLEEILEAKQVGIIYHFTTINAIKTLLDDKIMSKYQCDILTFASRNTHLSTTRNFNMANDPIGTFNPVKYRVRVAIDGNKLSNKYKIKPINGLIDNNPEIFGTDINKLRVPHKSEQEEVVLCPSKSRYFPLKDYIIEFQIYNHNNEESKEIKEYIESSLKKYNLNIPVIISRKWQSAKLDEEDYEYNKHYNIELKEINES